MDKILGFGIKNDLAIPRSCALVGDPGTRKCLGGMLSHEAIPTTPFVHRQSFYSLLVLLYMV